MHGGTWRAAYKANSYTEVSAVLYAVQSVAPYAALGGVGALAFAMRNGGKAKL